MRKSIAASIRISEIRDRLVELDGIETRSTEQDTEVKSLMKERTEKEAEYRSESKSEEEAALHPRDFNVKPETRERIEIRSKTGLAEYFSAAAGGREVTGAAREYADACGIGPLSRLPMAIFRDGQPETRAVTPGPAVDGPVRPVVPFVFERSAAASLGIMFPSVPAGQVQIPKVTAPRWRRMARHLRRLRRSRWSIRLRSESPDLSRSESRIWQSCRAWKMRSVRRCKAAWATSLTSRRSTAPRAS